MKYMLNVYENVIRSRFKNVLRVSHEVAYIYTYDIYPRFVPVYLHFLRTVKLILFSGGSRVLDKGRTNKFLDKNTGKDHVVI